MSADNNNNNNNEPSYPPKAFYERDEEASPRKVRQGSIFEQIQELRNSKAYRGKERKGDFFETAVKKISGGDGIEDIVAGKTRSAGGYVSSDDDLERLTDNLISDTDGEQSYLDTSELDASKDDGAESSDYNSSGPITSYDDLFQADKKPNDAYNFEALSNKSSDEERPDKQMDEFAFGKDKMSKTRAYQEIEFEETTDGGEDDTQRSAEKSVQFKNLPAHPPELVDKVNEDQSDEYTEEEVTTESGDMEGVEVTEEVEEIEEYEEIHEEEVVEEIAEQMDDYSSSSESKPIPDVVHQKPEKEESSEYDPELEYDASDSSDDDEADDEEGTDQAIDSEMAPLEIPEGTVKSQSKPGETPKTARTEDTDDMQSDIMSSDEENLVGDSLDHGKLVAKMLATNQSEREQHPQNGNALFATAGLDSEQHSPELKLDPEAQIATKSATSFFDDDGNAKPESARAERKRMLPYVICFALTIVIGVIVALVVLSGRKTDVKPSTVIPITPTPTGEFTTSAPVDSGAPINSPSLLPPVFVPPTEPTSAPVSVPTPVPAPSPVLPPSPSAPPPTRNPTPRPTVSPTIGPTTMRPQVPPEEIDNDSCINAIGPLNPDGSVINGDFTGATPDEVDRCGDVTTQGPGVWYYVIGTGGEMMAHTCINGRSDTKITVFKGTCLKPECIGGNDNFCGLQSAVSWQSTYRQLYRILVHGPDVPFFFGTFSLAVEARVNDECQTAAGPLTIGTGPLVVGNTLNANPNPISCDGEQNVSPSVWYKIRGTGSDITASLCSGTDFNARISVLTGACHSDVTAFQCVARSEPDACDINFDSQSFTDYYLLIHGTLETDAGQFGLRLSTSALQDNDVCSRAIGPLPVDDSITLGSTAGASAERSAPFCESAATAPGVWYYVVGTGGVLQASLCNSDDSYDSRLSVYEGSCENNDLNQLDCVAGNDDFCGLQALVRWNSQVGVRYQILVHGYLLSSGDFALTIGEIGFS